MTRRPDPLGQKLALVRASFGTGIAGTRDGAAWVGGRRDESGPDVRAVR